MIARLWTEVVAFSLWDGENSIAAFAGGDIQHMVLYPEDEAFLASAPSLIHYRVHEPIPVDRTTEEQQ